MTNGGGPDAELAQRSVRSLTPISAGTPGLRQLLAAFTPAHEQTRVLRQDDTLAVFDQWGDVKPGEVSDQGLYHQGTRFLSCLLLEVHGSRPILLSSTIGADEDQLDVHCTNPDVLRDEEAGLRLGTLHLGVSKFLWRGVCYQRLWVKNLGLRPVESLLSLYFEADYKHVVEARDEDRPHGRHLPPGLTDDRVVLGYVQGDGVVRRTVLQFDPPPSVLTGSTAVLNASLQPQQAAAFYVTIACKSSSAQSLVRFDDARAAARADRERYSAASCDVATSQGQSNAFIRRALADLRMMTTELRTGPYPYAGVPHFNTTLARDSIVTALECLWLRPQLARGVLAHLAANQATEATREEGAEPGRIPDETGAHETTGLKLDPSGRDFRGADTTPLFVLLAGAYYERTADRPFVESLWPKIEAAMNWIDRYGDRDGDGFIECHEQSAEDLVRQARRDSDAAVFHADGSPAFGWIARCEVQAYVYAARRAAAALAGVLGQSQLAARLTCQAEELRERFEQEFWCEELSTYAMALDRNKRPCRVRTSNAGHCLFAGIASPERARRLARTLVGAESFSGWGVRTLAVSEHRYTPLGHHTGAIRPHDNALIAQGLTRYDLAEEVLQVANGLFNAATHFDLHHMPELFCGFPRESGRGPLQHPMACAPQACSAASLFLLLQACLGLEINGPAARVCFTRPQLPPSLPELRIHNLQVAGARLDLLLVRHEHGVAVKVLRGDREVQVLGK